MKFPFHDFTTVLTYWSMQNFFSNSPKDLWYKQSKFHSKIIQEYRLLGWEGIPYPLVLPYSYADGGCSYKSLTEKELGMVEFLLISKKPALRLHLEQQSEKL